MDFDIRLEEGNDYRIVEELTREAFWNLHLPGCDEHFAVNKLRKCSSYIPELDLVAEMERKIIGHIIYTR